MGVERPAQLTAALSDDRKIRKVRPKACHWPFGAAERVRRPVRGRKEDLGLKVAYGTQARDPTGSCQDLASCDRLHGGLFTGHCYKLEGRTEHLIISVSRLIA